VTPPLRAHVEVTLKAGIRDPQGQAIESALASLGFPGVANVRVGKQITFELPGPRAEAERAVAAMCEKLLANPVIEDYAFRLVEADGAARRAAEETGAPPGGGLSGRGGVPSAGRAGGREEPR
jgi:phosphoribosylformylglycinamidine synthase subunit PurS